MGYQQLLGVGHPVASAPAFTPASLTGLVAWYDAQDASTITQVAGAVSQWNDKSATAVNVTQANALNQPTYSATGFPGSKPGITFSRTGSTSLNNLTAAAFPSGYTDFTFWTVYAPTSNSNFQGVYAIYDSVVLNDTLIAFDFQSNLAPTVFSSFIGEIDGSDPHVSTSPYYFRTVRDASGNITMAANATPDSSGSQPSSPTTVSTGGGNTYVGTDNAGDLANGVIGEIILYSRALNSTEIGQVETYLSARWGI